MGSSLGGQYKYGVCLDTSQLNLEILLDVYFHCTSYGMEPFPCYA